MQKKNEIIRTLASCSGHTGIAGGQELDLKFENKKLNQIIDMEKQENYFISVYMQLQLQTKVIKKNFLGLGEDIGLLFQLADDFLDNKGSIKLVGKPVKKDDKKGKSTF